ncbi:PKD domain-containing protein, partial [Marivivens marinus]|uniref:PKD domain-containing protein n=1 Tax=Marivivens marinus TaxID=3110173 RepID=UPI003B84711C
MKKYLFNAVISLAMVLAAASAVFAQDTISVVEGETYQIPALGAESTETRAVIYFATTANGVELFYSRDASFGTSGQLFVQSDGTPNTGISTGFIGISNLSTFQYVRANVLNSSLVNGQYSFEVQIWGDLDPDTKTTFIGFSSGAPSNAAPVANAGPDQTVSSAASVTLDGTTSSDADSDALTYAWTQTSGTSVTLSSTTAAQPTFTAPTLAVGDADAVLVFSLTVNDGTESSSADAVTITVEAPSNAAPVANAGPDQTVSSAASVTL